HSVGVHVLGGALQLRERCDRDQRVLGLLVVDLEQYGLVGLDDQRAITHTSLYTCLLAGVVRCVAAGDRLSSGSCRTVRALLPLDCRAVIGGRRSNGIRRAIPAVSEDARMVRSDSGWILLWARLSGTVRSVRRERPDLYRTGRTTRAEPRA